MKPLHEELHPEKNEDLSCICHSYFWLRLDAKCLSSTPNKSDPRANPRAKNLEEDISGGQDIRITYKGCFCTGMDVPHDI